MKQDSLANLSASTVGRMLNDLKRRAIAVFRQDNPQWQDRPANGKKTEENQEETPEPGHTGGLVKADSIVRFTNGIKRYIVTAIDKEAKFAFAYAYKSHSSDAAADFMKNLSPSLRFLSLTFRPTTAASSPIISAFFWKSQVSFIFTLTPDAPK